VVRGEIFDRKRDAALPAKVVELALKFNQTAEKDVAFFDPLCRPLKQLRVHRAAKVAHVAACEDEHLGNLQCRQNGKMLSGRRNQGVQYHAQLIHFRKERFSLPFCLRRTAVAYRDLGCLKRMGRDLDNISNRQRASLNHTVQIVLFFFVATYAVCRSLLFVLPAGNTERAVNSDN